MKTWEIGAIEFEDDGQSLRAKHPSGYVGVLPWTNFLEDAESPTWVLDFVQENLDMVYAK